ncbi:MAG: hypothetical protein DME04_01555 [Candidatus Rokuibacteriota bacterium]|nr:MAG: hypothetical protein DME04_01555 [Candidatus Rokubacteria bacterium]
MRTAWYLIVVLVLGLALTLSTVSTRAETTNCVPITVVPVAITVQGIYCFTQHLGTGITTGAAIEIQTNNVILDLNGFKLGGLAAGPGTQAIGISADNRQNITIKNGTVRGFYEGIRLNDSSGASLGHVVENIRADQNTHAGIEVNGRGNLIRNNQVVATGGSTFTLQALGILVSGTGTRVLNNDVIDTYSSDPSQAEGIYLIASNALVVNNRITNASVGIHFVGSGKYRDNLTTGVSTPFMGGTNASNNN